MKRSKGISCTRMTGVNENVDAKNTPNKAEAVTSKGHEVMQSGMAAVDNPHMPRQKA